ncbi:NAD(P)H-dependent glycerol-3-phosphate dehydrogenase [Candidatus Daviesbacteria bacterium]|nr:NAD(P)H-dependent glycerol-3-phosphate dehydrogenase [Candidatus Daviesbacteria bacterium]
MFKDKEKITIAVGPAGAWPSAFTKVMAERNHNVRLFFRNPLDLEYFQSKHQTPRLPGIEMSPNVKGFTDVKTWIDGAELVALGPPSIHFREFWNTVKTSVKNKTDILILSKGLEQITHLRMSEIILQTDSSRIDHIAVLSGPNQAQEVAEGELAGATLAAYNKSTGNRLQKRLNSKSFNVYTSDDVVGVEIAAALKNVLALGAGMADGFKVASSTKAFYLTRALGEITAIGTTIRNTPLKGHESTFIGLAGCGDFSLSCYGGNTRNHWAGERIVEGWSVQKILAAKTLEGYYALQTAKDLIRGEEDQYPIISALYGIWYEDVPIRGNINQLLGRQPVKEQFKDKGFGFRTTIFLMRMLHNLRLSHIRK